MAQVGTQTDEAKKSLSSNIMPPEFAAMGKNYVEELGKMQSQMFEKLQEANRSWLDRVKSEADLAAELRVKLAAARSIPETAAVYQEWGNRRIEIAAEDTKHIFADGQKFMETTTRLLSNGWLSNGHAGKP